MGSYFSSHVQTFFPDTHDPYLRLIVRCKIVTETISIPVNIILLIVFHHLYQKKKNEVNKGPDGHPKDILHKSTVILTYLLLIFGAIFGILQGLLENFALPDCADITNTYFEFFFYIGHRTLLLLIFLNRLYLVFERSPKYKYPDYVYYVLLVLICINGVLSFLSHNFNLSIMKVPSGWDLWNDGDNVCAWQFGPFVTYITRPIDFGLNIIILGLFLYKLYLLHSVMKQMEVKEAEHMRRVKEANISSHDACKASISNIEEMMSGDDDIDGQSSMECVTPSDAATLEANVSSFKYPRNGTDREDTLKVQGHKASSFDGDESNANGVQSMSAKRKLKKKIADKYRRRRRKHSKLEIVARRMSVLTFVAVVSSIIVTGGYLGYHIRIIGALWPFDIVLNSFCCMLMFKFTNFMIAPCFGTKCDRCCCIKYLGCCNCVFIGKCCEILDDKESENEVDSHKCSVELQLSQVQDTKDNNNSTVGSEREQS